MRNAEQALGIRKFEKSTPVLCKGGLGLRFTVPTVAVYRDLRDLSG